MQANAEEEENLTLKTPTKISISEEIPSVETFIDGGDFKTVSISVSVYEKKHFGKTVRLASYPDV